MKKKFGDFTFNEVKHECEKHPMCKGCPFPIEGDTCPMRVQGLASYFIKHKNTKITLEDAGMNSKVTCEINKLKRIFKEGFVNHLGEFVICHP